MINYLVPKVHIAHATIKITLPHLLTGQAIVDMALRMLPFMITTLAVSLTVSGVTWPLLLMGSVNPCSLIHPVQQPQSNPKVCN